MQKNKTLKRRFLSGLLTLALIVGLAPTIGGMAAPQKVHAAGKTVSASISYGDTYSVDGWPSRHWYANISGPSPQKTAYCIQPTKGPDEGSATATQMSQASDLSQAMYYCQGYPGWSQARVWLESQSWSGFWLDAGRGNGYALSHYALSIIWGQDDFKGDISDSHYNQAEAFANYLKSLPAPPADTSVNVTPMTNTGIWLTDQTGYKAGAYTFTCNAGNRGNYTVPAGFKLTNLSTGTTYNAGSNVDLTNGTKFEIVDMSGARSGGDTWTSANITSNLKDYTPYRFDAASSFQDIIFFAEEQGDSATFKMTYQNKARISIVKFITDDKDVNFEAGAKFQIHNTAFPSYDAAAKSAYANAATITTNAGGAAISPYLVPGTYLVHQIDGDKNYKYMEDQTIAISADGTTYKVEGNAAGKNDELLRLAVKVIKVDATTGKTIPVAGVGFKIKDADGKWVSISYAKEDNDGNYNDVTVDEFFTNNAGIMMTPGKLKAGTYTLHETSAPKGYVLNPAPMAIELSRNTEVILSNDVAEFNFKNDPQKGRLNITKVGELVSVEDGQLVTGSETAIPYAVFDIVAAEDIVTPDGTIRAKKGDVVQKDLMTDENGKAASDELFLGKYDIYETAIMKKVDGQMVKDNDSPYVIPKDPIASVDIKYTNQQVAVNNVEVKITNRNAAGTVEITKSDVSDGKLLPNTGIQILDKDKNVILKGRTDKNGKVTFGPLPVGKYYFQEFDAPKGYKIDSSLFPFEIKENGEIVKCKMTNTLKDDPYYPGDYPGGPQTGDTFSLLPYLLAALISGAITVTLLVRRKKIKNRL